MASRNASRTVERANLYQITEGMITQLEADHVAWIQPWMAKSAAVGIPHKTPICGSGRHQRRT